MKIDSSNNTYNVQQNSLAQNQPKATNNKPADTFESVVAQVQNLVSQIAQSSAASGVKGAAEVVNAEKGKIETFDFDVVAAAAQKKSWWAKLVGAVVGLVAAVVSVVAPVLAPVVAAVAAVVVPIINKIAGEESA